MAYAKKKEFDFEKHALGSFLFLDIETVAREKEIEEDTPLYESFVYKMRYTEEAQRKDFNSYNVKALYAEKAALYPEFGKVVCITVGKIVDGKLILISFNDEDEVTLLTRFHKALYKWAAEDENLALCGVNLKFFDLRFIYIRSIVHQIVPVKGHINLTGLKPWEVYTADLTDYWKQTSPYNAPMLCIAEVLGLPNPKSDIDGSQVSSTYHNEGAKGLQRITEYCERDVLTTANIAMKLRFLPILELADTKKKSVAKPVKGTVAKPVNSIKEAKKIAVKLENTTVSKATDTAGFNELPPLLQRIYNLNAFDQFMEKELREIIGKKRLSVADKKNLKTILTGVYIRTDFVNADQDTKAIKEQKTEEVDNFINSL